MGINKSGVERPSFGIDRVLGKLLGSSCSDIGDDAVFNADVSADNGIFGVHCMDLSIVYKHMYILRSYVF